MEAIGSWALVILGVLITTAITTSAALVVKSNKKQAKRINKRLDVSMDCHFTAFEAFKQMGVNGSVGKKMDELKKTVIKD